MFALSKPELRRILDAVASASVTASVLTQPFGRRDYLLMLFLYHTGLRVGECSRLLTCLVSDDGTPRQFLHLPAAICDAQLVL